MAENYTQLILFHWRGGGDFSSDLQADYGGKPCQEGFLGELDGHRLRGLADDERVSLRPLRHHISRVVARLPFHRLVFGIGQQPGAGDFALHAGKFNFSSGPVEDVDVNSAALGRATPVPRRHEILVCPAGWSAWC